MSFIPFLLSWPLRKAALIPVAAISACAVGAAFGSFDLSRRATALLLPSGAEAQQRPYTTLVSSVAATGVAAAIVSVREVLLAPAPVPPLVLPTGPSVAAMQRIRNGVAVAAVS